MVSLCRDRGDLSAVITLPNSLIHGAIDKTTLCSRIFQDVLFYLLFGNRPDFTFFLLATGTQHHQKSGHDQKRCDFTRKIVSKNNHFLNCL